MSGASITRSRAITSADVLLIAAVPLLALFPLHNNDLWWHLATGKWIAAHHAVPRDDIFAWTHYMRGWIDNEWLSQVIFYGVWKLGGDRALIVLRAMLFGAMAVLLRRTTGARIFPFALAAAIALSHHWWELRPSVFSLLGLLTLMILMQRGRWWWIPPLFLLWANLHPGFVVGLVVFAGVIVARAITKWGAGVRISALSFVASIAATLINPYGWRIYEQQLTVASNREYRALLDEWIVPPVPFLLFAIAILIIGALSMRRVPLPRLIPLFATATMSMTAVRFEEYCAWIAVPIALWCLRRLAPGRASAAQMALVLITALVGWWPPAAKPSVRLTQSYMAIAERQRIATIVALAAALWSARRSRRASAGDFARRSTWIVTSLAVILIAATRQDAIERGRYPDKCLDAVAGRIFNRLSWGGWLIWKRGIPVFIDGRYAGQRIFFDYVAAQVRFARPLLARWGIDTVIVAADDGTAAQLWTASEWSLVCRDEASLVFRRKAVTQREFSP